ncbi:unnamed protein product [Cuscuta campestris]|uniref:Uncharacterized protein n=1 Tax=Cuscuta campestris TaxID=132261 RepID=A0A484KL82_9ASTE|nr:unnamed protein product [Cuscuta campestris]
MGRVPSTVLKRRWVLRTKNPNVKISPGNSLLDLESGNGPRCISGSDGLCKPVETEAVADTVTTGLELDGASTFLSESNMLYVDSTVGTGFSFSNTSSDYTKWDYTMTVNENMKFLLKWFEEFPKYRNLHFYLAGDDSEGHLIPQLAALVLEYNKNNVTPIKLKGIALGNLGIGTPGIDEGDILWYHGVISEELYTILKTRMRGNVICNQCPSDATSVYLNKPEVQKALHANKTRLPYRWDSCAGPLTLLPAFETKNFNTLTSLLKRHIRVLLYRLEDGSNHLEN